ncbi:hypothetical protein [Bradyrhizobium sp. AZCC 2289]|uniref:hypothetical protein n=1 Tax=Bradyrhizobium sp. AZCC 2289 TaxID=3117026 RepID=UPI002FF1CF35
MTDYTLLGTKPVMLILYLALLLFVCAWPFAVQLRRSRQEGRIAPLLFGALLVDMAVLLLKARGWPGPTHPVVLGLVLVLPLMRLGPAAVLGGLGTLQLLAGVTWWTQDIDLGWLRGLAFVLLGGLAAWLPRLFSQSAPVPAAAVLLPVGALGLLSMLMTGPFGTPGAFWLLWHHWGVFVSSSEAILAGFVPFRDFPVQYGMGPALMVAAVCGGDCWGALYVVAGTANLLYALAVVSCALLQAHNAERGAGIMAAAAAGAAALLWTGHPPDFLGPLAFPSVAGLRFLPVACLLLAILIAERHGRAPGWVGHGLWALAVAWSPEAAAHASIVWWPYLALRRAQAAADGRGVLLALLRGVLLAVGALLLVLGLLVLVFRLGFGAWPLFPGVLVFVSNPPGMLPPNLFGPLSLAIFAILAGCLVLPRLDPSRQRSDFASMAAFVAVGSYYLGRSHDNNLLNLFPFLAITVSGLLRPGLPAVVTGFARTALAGLLGWLACFGLGAWEEAQRDSVAWRTGPAAMLRAMSLNDLEGWDLLARFMAANGAPHGSLNDAREALAWLRAQGAEAPVFANGAMVMPRGAPGQTWTGMQNLGSFATLPPQAIEQFIRAGATTARREGWLLLDTQIRALRSSPVPDVQAGAWLDAYRSGYEVAEELRFGDYIAYRLVPR